MSPFLHQLSLQPWQRHLLNKWPFSWAWALNFWLTCSEKFPPLSAPPSNTKFSVLVSQPSTFLKKTLLVPPLPAQLSGLAHLEVLLPSLYQQLLHHPTALHRAYSQSSHHQHASSQPFFTRSLLFMVVLSTSFNPSPFNYCFNPLLSAGQSIHSDFWERKWGYFRGWGPQAIGNKIDLGSVGKAHMETTQWPESPLFQ